jgi:hypothetical protein
MVNHNRILLESGPHHGGTGLWILCNNFFSVILFFLYMDNFSLHIVLPVIVGVMRWAVPWSPTQQHWMTPGSYSLLIPAQYRSGAKADTMRLPAAACAGLMVQQKECSFFVKDWVQGSSDRALA